VQTLCTDVNSRTNTSGGTLTDAANNSVDPVALLKRKLPQTSWTNAPAVADLFLTYLFFGEGQANLDLYRQAAIDFLNDGSADSGGPTARRFDQLDPNTSTSYQLRVRGMVSLLMTTQRFQEQ
jgi:hypothetical protein